MADSNEDLARRAAMAQEILGRVIHTTDNLDDKVGKVFSSMSFLTVGATILYTAFIADRLYYRVGGVDLIALLFVAYIISVGVATAFMLQAMGPRVNFVPWRRPGGQANSSAASPTGYADRIATMKEQEWTELFTKTGAAELTEKWYAESIKEIYELSRKVERKAGEMRGAQWFFLLAIVFLVLMVILAAVSTP